MTKEIYFYLAVGGAVLLNEAGITHGFYIFTLCPSVVVVLVVGLWAFKNDPR